MNEIKAVEKSIRQLLQNTHFAVDYYQREYKWETKQVNELINDLTEKFSSYYSTEDDRTKIKEYGSYFLGSIIVCEKEGKKYIIDGQQRLTTITLLLIFIKNVIQDDDQKLKLLSLIFSDVYGQKTFNIDVEERRECMEHLLRDDILNGDFSESITNIIYRYIDIKQSPNLNELDEKKLIFFSDWLIENVYLVEIKTETDEDAYAIFESMNDRGLSLTPLDILRGYLLSRIDNSEKRKDAVKCWKDHIERIRKLGKDEDSRAFKDEDSEAFKAWFRSQYAESTRERKLGASPKDFEKIGTEFHRWIKENEERLNLYESDDFYVFIKKGMSFFITQYIKIRKASLKLTKELEPIFYNASLNFTLQYPLLLAPLVPDDDEDVINKKFYLVATYIDLLISRRIWNFKSISYDVMQYLTFNVIKDIRKQPLEDLRKILREKIEDEKINFDNIFYLHNMNRFYIRYILARITDFIEKASGMEESFDKYMAKGKTRYEVEHIWANHPEWFIDEFPSALEFEQYRNRLGGLLIIPKSFNASFGDLKYEDKLELYYGQSNNLLAKSLHPKCYEHNPGFIAFEEKYNLPFKQLSHFKKKNLDERQELYTELARLVWSPERLNEV